MASWCEVLSSVMSQPQALPRVWSQLPPGLERLEMLEEWQDEETPQANE